MKILVNLSNMLLCEALAMLIKNCEEGHEVVVANNAGDVGNFIPDKIIADYRTLIQNHTERWPHAKIFLMDTGLEEEEIITLLLNYPLDGIIKTDCNMKLFKKALKAVEEGQIWIDNNRIKSLLRHAESLSNAQHDPGLSKKEREIVILIAQGRKNKEIAGTLSISEQTVKSHISRIFRKKNISCRTQLVPLAMKLKLPHLE